MGKIKLSCTAGKGPLCPCDKRPKPPNHHLESRQQYRVLGHPMHLIAMDQALSWNTLATPRGTPPAQAGGVRATGALIAALLPLTHDPICTNTIDAAYRCPPTMA
jgi:hypothetical protein